MKNKIPVSLKKSIWKERCSNNNESNCVLCMKVVGKPTSLGGKSKYASAEFGHKVPESKGGKMDKTNLEIMCKTCNVKMGTESMQSYVKTKPINMDYGEDIICYMALDGDSCYEYLENGSRCKNKPVNGFLCHIHKAPHKTLDPNIFNSI